MYDFVNVRTRVWRDPNSDVTVSMDEDKNTWTIRTIDGQCLAYTQSGRPKRFRSLASALQYGRAIVNRYYQVQA